jgi:glutamine amidotransferase
MANPKVTIIDYGVGNLLSVQRGLHHCGAATVVTSDPDLVLAADRVVLPGVGAFANAMEALQERDLVTAIQAVAQKGAPLLAICLGMQLLLDESEEFGVTKGLGLISGRVVAIPLQKTNGESQKMPHIGWNNLQLSETHPGWKGTLFQDNHPGESVYFVHSFMSQVTDSAHQLAHCYYGGHIVQAAISKDSITGCQFHPEKSGEVGLKILRRFCAD